MSDVYGNFRAVLTSALASSATDDERVRSVGAILPNFISSPEFLHACIERVALTMQCGRTHWRNPAFDEDIETGYLARMIFWPAHYRGDVHRHNLWTVTAVLYNEIDVVLFDPTGSTEVSRFHGTKGAVGRVAPPCVHAAENNSNVPSVTLAIFCRQSPKERRGPEVEWITTTQESKYAAGGFNRALRAFVFIINENRCAKSLELLDMVYSLADPSLKLLVAKAIAQIDPRRAARRLDDIAYQIEDREIRRRVDDARETLELAIEA